MPKAITIYSQADKQSFAITIGSRHSRKGDTQANVLPKGHKRTMTVLLKAEIKQFPIQNELNLTGGKV